MEETCFSFTCLHVVRHDGDDSLYGCITGFETDIIEHLTAIFPHEIADQGVDERLSGSFDLFEIFYNCTGN